MNRTTTVVMVEPPTWSLPPLAAVGAGRMGLLKGLAVGQGRLLPPCTIRIDRAWGIGLLGSSWGAVSENGRLGQRAGGAPRRRPPSEGATVAYAPEAASVELLC